MSKKGGQVYLSDRRTGCIRMFTAAGKTNHVIIANGQISHIGFIALHNDLLFVVDWDPEKHETTCVKVFKTDGTYVRTLKWFLFRRKCCISG